MRVQIRKIALLGTASCLSMIAAGAMAQDQDDGFLGTLILGESKREIQTDTAVPVTNIDQEEINDRQANTVAELIDSVPGVSLVNGSTPQGSGINIRGYGANGTFGTDQKVLILVDGATTGAEELYRIGNQLFTDPQLYKSVSVIRGTVGSFEYGSGVVGGVVQLDTKDASDFTGGEPGFRFRQTFEGYSNGNGFASSSILAWQPNTQTEFLFNYTYRDQDDQEDGNGNTIGNSAFTLPSLLAKGKYSFGNDLEHSFTASYNQSTSEERDVPYDSFGTTSDAFGNVDRDIETKIGILRYQYQPTGNDLVDLDVNLSYSEQAIESSYVSGSSSLEGTPFFPGIQALADATHNYETTKLTIKNTSYFQTGIASHDLRAGIEFINRERLDAASAPGGTDRRFALFAVDDVQIGDNLTITPAVRYETQDIDGDDAAAAPFNESYDNNALMGGLSARYAFNSGFAIFGGAAYTESLPIIDDLGTPLYMTQPERSRTWEAGFSYDRGDVFAEGDVIRAKVNFYQTTLWDITSYVSGTPSQPLSEVETKGAEIEASYANAGGFYVDFNSNIVTGTETSATGDDSRWRNEPSDSARLTLGKRFGQTLDVSWEIFGARAGTDSSGDATAGYGVNSLRATYMPQEGVFEGFELRAGIENILDKDYRPNLSTRNSTGRTFKLGLAKTF
ncbi:TonB-dependent receptor domain-containing protein [Ruegeria faecimaris]|uniref:Hemoglobin/transferrin/lactoferrin receptor protein n=1 Tax=Ruegeria faecimaris TaxID=686389 RepID=A0A521DQX5_9RHOB|nr:TonB-dependent receptor [Ruegeria faecimaris]SMO74106.1 hemoglobin/transferrin/lactoferrin receptor protein [Ruegeria faecimaris]